MGNWAWRLDFNAGRALLFNYTQSDIQLWEYELIDSLTPLRMTEYIRAKV